MVITVFLTITIQLDLPSVAYGEGYDGVSCDGGGEGRSESGEGGEAADDGSGGEGEGHEEEMGGAGDLEIIIKEVHVYCISSKLKRLTPFTELWK